MNNKHKLTGFEFCVCRWFHIVIAISAERRSLVQLYFTGEHWCFFRNDFNNYTFIYNVELTSQKSGY